MTTTGKSVGPVLALIPARGGSKGIPRKNVRPINGRPLIEYTIELALQSSEISRVLVSTDDQEIADVARACGAEVPFQRPVEFAGDLSPDVDVFRHVLEWLNRVEGYEPELVVHLRPTGPVRRVELVNEAIALMKEHPDADALRSVSVSEQTPYKMWKQGNGPWLEPLLAVDGVREPFSMPRQMLPTIYWQNGYVDIVRPRTVLDKGGMAGDRVLSFLIEDPIFDLDYEDSIPLVERALKALKAGEPLPGAQTTGRHSV